MKEAEKFLQRQQERNANREMTSADERPSQQATVHSPASAAPPRAMLSRPMVSSRNSLPVILIVCLLSGCFLAGVLFLVKNKSGRTQQPRAQSTHRGEIVRETVPPAAKYAPRQQRQQSAKSEIVYNEEGGSNEDGYYGPRGRQTRAPLYTGSDGTFHEEFILFIKNKDRSGYSASGSGSASELWGALDGLRHGLGVNLNSAEGSERKNRSKLKVSREVYTISEKDKDYYRDLMGL